MGLKMQNLPYHIKTPESNKSQIKNLIWNGSGKQHEKHLVISHNP
jgi:hypothetical protein